MFSSKCVRVLASIIIAPPQRSLWTFSAAPVIINPGTNGTDTEGKVPAGGDQNCKIRVGRDGVTVKVGNYHVVTVTS